MKCPFCSSTDTIFKAKAAKWECNSCEERFEGTSPESDASKQTSSPKAAKPKRIFFSYGHDANRELVDRFKVDLETRGHQVWIDYKQIGTWDNWKEAITRGIHDAEMAIAFLSIHSTRDPGVCRNEVAMALQHFGKVYPVLVEQVPPESIPVTIAHLQWPDLSRWREFRDQEDLDFERFYEEKFLEIVSRVEGEAGRFASEADVLRRVLNPSGFEGRFARHLAGFTGREWVFDAYENWLNHQPTSRVFWVKAGPGFGKTALAVQMANRHRAAIVATWFCDHQSVELRDPIRALQTIAYQLALRWDDYRARLLPRLRLFADSSPERIEEARQDLAKKSLHDLFSFLISEPMAGLIWREHKLVILVDALDEGAEADGTNPLASLISGRFLELPEWIGFVVTSRPDASVVGHLQAFKPFAIEAGDSRNTADLQAFFEAQVAPFLLGLDTGEQERICGLLVEKSEGMMLYLRLVAEGLKEGTLEVGDLETLDAGLPGLYSRYHAAFEARFRQNFKESVQPLLRIVMAAPGPIPLDLATEILGLDRETAVQTRALIASYLVEDSAGLSLFHKTLGEWMGSEKAGGYFTDTSIGKKQIKEHLLKCFESRETGPMGTTLPMIWEDQVLSWLPEILDTTSSEQDRDLLEALVTVLHERARYTLAHDLLQRHLPCYERAYIFDHSKTLGIISKLGELLCEMGKFTEAEKMHRCALKGRKDQLGVDNPDTCSSFMNLAKLLHYSYFLGEKSNLDEAESFYRLAIAGFEKNLGDEDSKTLITKNNFAQFLLVRGQIQEAESLSRAGLEIRKKSCGLLHKNTLTSLATLASVLGEKGENHESEKLLREVLEGREKLLGPDHPETLKTANNLALHLRQNGKLCEAEVLARRALEGFEASLGANNIKLRPILKNLSEIAGENGKEEESNLLKKRIQDLF